MDQVHIAQLNNTIHKLGEVPGLRMPEPLAQVQVISDKLDELRRSSDLQGRLDLFGADTDDLVALWEDSLAAHQRQSVLQATYLKFETALANRTLAALTESRDGLWDEYRRLAGEVVAELGEHLQHIPATALQRGADLTSHGKSVMTALGAATELTATLDQYEQLRTAARGDLARTGLDVLFLAAELPAGVRSSELLQAVADGQRGSGTLAKLHPVAITFNGLAVPESRHERCEELVALEHAPSEQARNNALRLRDMRANEQRANWAAALNLQ